MRILLFNIVVAAVGFTTTNCVVSPSDVSCSLCDQQQRQRRQHKSEMNKLNNTLELQKSKEGRLQSHIQSLEKQITDMVNDYESRLQDAFYDNM